MSEISTSVAPTESNPEITFRLKESVTDLQAKLLSRHPQMPTLLHTIHKTLRQYPEQVTVLSPEEINVIVEGLKVQTNTQFAVAATKSAGKSSKALGAKLANLLGDNYA